MSWGIYCKNGFHTFEPRFDEDIIKSTTDLTKTQIRKTYLFDICIICGKIVYPNEEEEKKK